MKKAKRILPLLLTTLLFSCVILTGCGKKEIKAVESAQILFDLYVKQDTTNVEKITLTKEEADSVIKVEKQAIKGLISNNFENYKVTITDEELDSIVEKQLTAMSKITPEIELVSEKDGISEVKVKSKYIDLVGADEKAVDDAIKKFKNSGITDETELLTKMKNEYLKNIINELDNIQVSEDTKEETYKFKKDKRSNVWIPKNLVEFELGICDLIQKQ
ncbi:hypothetical protein [Clostridium uliginosum]|uniref:DUF5105 domain-containing protein n=1 Tax=Clostridium uliginosum TaxID=119641 RepID=A0A1I1RYR2_9CLOT|nr:hypothetical protein [Clostridium uliginosum]SFD35790.1 hypothetical protein SAMN05421842_13610 [Clostridium uliginosum]